MAKLLDPKDIVSFDELLMSEVVLSEARSTDFEELSRWAIQKNASYVRSKE